MKVYLYSTTDAGKNWQKIQTDIGYNPVKIYFKDKNTGYVASSGSYKGSQKNNIFHNTTDGGKTWQHIDISSATTNVSNTHDMFFKGYTGWICGGINDQGGMTHKVQIVKTIDGGINWDYVEIEKIGDATSIFFPDNSNGWFMTQWGSIYKSINGGTSWTKQYEDKNKNPMICSYFLNSSTGWVGGAGGYLYYTENSGSTWSKLTTSIDSKINDIYFVNSSLGWVATAKGIYYSTDGGISWEAQEMEGGNTGVESLSIVDNKNGWTFNNNDVFNTNSGGSKVTRINAKIYFSGELTLCNGDSLRLTADPIETGYTYKWSSGETTTWIFVKKSGKYTVTIKAQDGTTDSASVDVLVREKPEITIVGDTALCPGMSGTISVKEKYMTYSWSNGESSQQAIINSPGDYSVEVTDSNGCANKINFLVTDKGLSSFIKDITILTIDSVGINLVRDSVLRFRNNSNYDYRITGINIKYDTAIFKIKLYSQSLPIVVQKGKELMFGVSFSPKETRKYIDSIIILSDDPCLSEKGMQLQGVGLTDTEVLEYVPIKDNYIIFPNPVMDYVEINGLVNDTITIQVLTLEGILMMEVNNERKLNVSRLCPGIYLLKAGNKVMKFIKL